MSMNNIFKRLFRYGNTNSIPDVNQNTNQFIIDTEKKELHIDIDGNRITLGDITTLLNKITEASNLLLRFSFNPNYSNNYLSITDIWAMTSGLYCFPGNVFQSIQNIPAELSGTYDRHYAIIMNPGSTDEHMIILLSPVKKAMYLGTRYGDGKSWMKIGGTVVS